MTVTDYMEQCQYVDGGREWPNVDCYGLALKVRKDLGLPDWPAWAGHTKYDGMDDIGEQIMATAERCEPQHGAVAACFTADMLVHVGVVMEFNGALHAIEASSRRGITFLPLNRLERRFLRVEYYI